MIRRAVIVFVVLAGYWGVSEFTSYSVLPVSPSITIAPGAVIGSSPGASRCVLFGSFPSRPVLPCSAGSTVAADGLRVLGLLFFLVAPEAVFRLVPTRRAMAALQLAALRTFTFI